MHFSLERRPSAAMIVAVTALLLALIGTAVAAPSAFKLNRAKVRKVADKEIAAKAPTLTVASAKSADKATTATSSTKATTADTATKATTADTATSATTADTAKNANALGGKSLDQIRPVAASATNSTSVNVAPGSTQVVSVTFTLAAASHMNVSAAVELVGADGDERGQCVVQRDGNPIGASFETTFDDIGTDNEATVAVEAAEDGVPAGDHTVQVRCNTLNGTISKEDAAVNVIAVPN